MQRLKWKSDFDKGVLTQNFEKRGWVKASNDGKLSQQLGVIMNLFTEDWNVYWANPWTVKQIFNPETGFRLNETQLLNHFPNHLELTRKDLMVKNIKRFRREMEKEGNPLAEKDDKGDFLYMEIVPMTYLLPGDYTIFVEEFRRKPDEMWIMKPTARA